MSDDFNFGGFRGDPDGGRSEGSAGTPDAITEDPTTAALLDAEKRLSELTDRHLRLTAEYDNYRRRAAREREAASESGAENVARPLLTVLDNLERAVANAGEAPGPWLAGVTLTLRQFLEALKTAGVTPLDPAHRPFNPVEHEALSTAPSDEVPADHVLTVISPGYRLNERVLRPAQVIVSSGPGVAPNR